MKQRMLWEEPVEIVNGHPVLFPFQSDLLERGRQAFLDGTRRVIWQASCGAGKTVVAAEQTKRTLEKNKTVLHIVHRRRLVDQMIGALRKFDISAAPIMQGRLGWDSKVKCASRDTLLAMVKDIQRLPEADLIIWDECFAGETRISTPSGPRRIDSLERGDLVDCASGIGAIKHVTCRPTSEIYLVEFSDGTNVKCTGNHPFFTDKGWTRAIALEYGSLSCGAEGLRYLWEDFSTFKTKAKARENARRGPGRIGLESSAMLLDILLKEAQEPFAFFRDTTEDKFVTTPYWASADSTWGERQATSAFTTRFTACSRRRMGSRICCSDRSAEEKWLSHELQNRHCESAPKDWDRTGWREPLCSGETISRYEEDCLPGWSRVVNVSRIKRESHQFVFNLHVSGHPSYFANGHLVHNCHVAAEAVQNWYLRFCSRSFWVGYTATPVGHEGKSLNPPYQKLVCCAPTSELLKAGRLCPVKVFNPDAVGRKRRKGEKVKPAGDPVEHWLKYCPGVPTVAFASTVAQSQELVQRYIARGISAEHIDANTPEDERERVFERSQSGETTVISNVGVMIEGVDLPWLVCCQILRGCNSLVFWFQATGRIMRVYPGKLFGIVLDHSAAAFEFFRPDDDVTWTLEDGATNERNNKLSKDRKPVACMGCGFVFTGKPACPECGRVIPKQRRKITLANMVPDDAVLTEFTEGQRLDIQQDAMRRMWSKLLWMGKAKGWPMGRIAGIFTKNAKRPPWEANLDVPLPHGKRGWQMPVSDWMEALANDPQELFQE